MPNYFTKQGIPAPDFYALFKNGERKQQLENDAYTLTHAFTVDHVNSQMNAWRHEKADIERIKLEAETDFE